MKFKEKTVRRKFPETDSASGKSGADKFPADKPVPDKPLTVKSETANSETDKSVQRTVSPASALFLSAFFGFLAASAKLGGNGAPLCAAIAAVLPPANGFAAFAGAMGSFFINDSFTSRITEITAMPAIIIARALISAVSSARGGRLAPSASGALSAAGYIICGIIAAFMYKITAALIMAIIFRGIISGAAAYFSAKLFEYIKNGKGLTSETKTAAAAVYVLVICMMCGISVGAFSLGRIAGAFAIAAAAFRYGFAGGAAAGALSAFAFGMTSPSMMTTAAVTVCGGLVSGFFSKKSKLELAAVFIVTVFLGSLVYGMPADAAKLLADVTAAAALFYIVPERLYRKPFGRIPAPLSAAAGQFSGRLKFAAESVADVRESFSKAARVLEKGGYEKDISAAVCGKVCTSCRSGAFCGESPEHRRETFFRPAESLLRKKGFLTEKELPDALEHCPKKTLLTETFNELYRLTQIEKRYGDVNGSLRELTVEQLSQTEDMLNYLSSGSETFCACDENLSEYVRAALEEYGAKKPSAAVFSDRDGRLYIDCFYTGLLTEKTEKLTERLCELTDRELDKPVAVTVNGFTHLRFHEIPVYEAEIGHASANGRDQTSGDSDGIFRDGLGNVCVLLSDGMGSGVKAAVESRMTVSVMTRMIRAGLGADAAVRLINSLLITKSPDEIFATIDFMKINLFTGKIEIVKLGAAQTFLKTNGTVKTVESRTTPVGIVSSSDIDRRFAQLSDGDEAVMITDGISESCFPRVRELMLSLGVTAQDCAERIIAEAEKRGEDDLSGQDDKTVYVVKIRKI